MRGSRRRVNTHIDEGKRHGLCLWWTPAPMAALTRNGMHANALLASSTLYTCSVHRYSRNS